MEYKCAKYGKSIIKITPQYTTQTCYNCGNVKAKGLGEREHNCEECKLKIGRDHNAALVIRAKGLGTSPRRTLEGQGEARIPFQA